VLRAIEAKEILPVGATQPITIDVRIVAATNRDLEAEVAEGRFREDLYYRLNVVTLRLAPLRERKDDLPALINHFLELYGNGHTLSGDLLELLLSYEWPGNVRELENCIQHMVAVNSGPVLHAGDAPSQLVNYSRDRRPVGAAMSAAAGAMPAGMPMGADGGGGFVTPVLPLAEMEKRAIIQALQYTKGDRVMAAHLLGIGRTTLYRKLKEYGIQD